MIEIILATLALLGNCGWIIEGRKHRQATRKVKAEADREELQLALDYVREFRENIYLPMESELNKMRDAIQTIIDCPMSADCPVTGRLRHNEAADKERKPRG